MEKVNIENINHLKEMIDKGKHNYVVQFGKLRSSKYITYNNNSFIVLHEIDDFEEELSEQELLESNIGKAIINKCLYVEY